MQSGSILESARMSTVTALLPPERQSPTSKVDWDQVSDLGSVRDSVIALRFGVSQTAVMLARQRRHIAPFRTRPKHNIDWDSVPLGEYLDEHLADVLGCSKVLVWKERNRRKIPPHGMLYRTLENEGAYYEEAIIDAWLHSQGTPHEFQKKIGPYRVDWFIEGVVWELLGMWDHRIYGKEYRANFIVKKAFLEAKGYSVREIHRNEMSSFKAEVNLRALLSLGNFVCRGCGRANVKHQAHAMCATCNIKARHGKELGPVREILRHDELFICASCGSTERKKRVRQHCAKCYLRMFKLARKGAL